MEPRLQEPMEMAEDQREEITQTERENVREQNMLLWKCWRKEKELEVLCAVQELLQWETREERPLHCIEGTEKTPGTGCHWDIERATVDTGPPGPPTYQRPCHWKMEILNW